MINIKKHFLSKFIFTIGKSLTAAAIIFSILSTINCKSSPVTPPENKPDTTSHVIQWSVDTIGVFQSTLFDIWGTDENNLYAVGTVQFPEDELPVNIIHWNGIKWNKVNYLEGDLSSIYGFSKNDIWVCGWWQIDFNGYPLIAHWDGVTWKTWKLQQYSPLISIWGTSSANMYACGRDGTILHFNGASWTKEESGTSIPLLKIWGVDEFNIFIAGEDDATGEGIILKKENRSWNIIARGGINPDSVTLYAGFRGIWSQDGKKIITAGSLIYEGNEGNWKLAEIPYNHPGDNIIGLAAFRDVYGTKNNDVYICGDYNLVIHWNGNNWHIYNELFNKSKPSNLYSVWAVGNKVFLTGYEKGKAIVYRGIRND